MEVISQEDRRLAQFTITSVLSDPELRRRVGLLSLMALSTTAGWWSVSTWIPQYAAELASNAGQSSQRFDSLAGLMYNAGGIAGYLVLGWLADTLGRKSTTWLYYLGSLGLSLCFFLLIRNMPALIFMTAANGFFTTGQAAWMTIYLPELFPTHLRGSAMCLVFGGSRSIAAFGPIMAGAMISSLGGISTAAAMMSLIYVVGLVVTPFAGPETKGKPLPA